MAKLVVRQTDKNIAIAYIVVDRGLRHYTY